MKYLLTLLFTLLLPLASAQSVMVEHKYGSTVIEGTPERVVTVGAVEQDALLALGIVPVGATEWIDGAHENGIWPWARARLDELGGELPTVVGNTQTGVDLERVLLLEPDLILGLYSAMTPEQYEQLSATAARSADR